MLPVIAIVGRPNVGKSTLFNCLTKSKDALVANLPGLTRDRKYGEALYDAHRFIVIDTGGIESESEGNIYQLMSQQTQQAINEADVILFVVDAKQGLTYNDRQIAQNLRSIAKPLYVVVNKTEGLDEEVAKSDFYTLGFEHFYAIASAHNRGVTRLVNGIFSTSSLFATQESVDAPDAIKIAVVGRPNVGKSTLINRMLGEERVIVYDEPGTTRDSIFIPFNRQNQNYILIDTAGVRRRGRISEEVEKFSVIKTLQAIEASQVVIFVFNAREGILDQDLKLLDFVMDTGKALVVTLNKWDGMSFEDKNAIKSEIDRRLEFVTFAKHHFISALHGTGVGLLFSSILQAYHAATKKISTSRLTRILQEAVTQHQPPISRGHRIKLRYAHAGGYNPPLIVIHGNQTESLPLDYLRYLTNFFRKHLKLVGTPIKIELKSSENPFKDKKNILTPRQQRKRKRLFKHHKK